MFSGDNDISKLKSKVDLGKSLAPPSTTENQSINEISDSKEGIFHQSSHIPRILVVDDNVDFLGLLCDILETEEYNIDSANDGLEGFEKWQNARTSNQPYNLLVADLVMPRMDGAELLAEIRKTDPTIPFIVLTGHTDLDGAFSLLDNYQISDFITKPLDSTERLLFSVKNALEKDQLYSKLKATNIELEHRVEQRTQELNVEKERAEFANKAKSDFLGQMSHELRTPMNAILGYAQILKMDAHDFDDEQLNTLNEILQAGQHLLTIIDELLDLAKVESGRQDIAMKSISISNAIQQSIALIQPLAEIRHQEIINHISTNDYNIRADETRLKQVLLNLLSNAVKYNHDHGHITLDCKLIDDQQLKIFITDSGEGLTEEKMAKLFTPFERLDKDKYTQGTGIGLVITRDLINLMGGSMGVESTLGEGCTFWLEFELAKD